MANILFNVILLLFALRCVLYMYTPSTAILWVSTGDFFHQLLVSGIALVPTLNPVGRFSVITLSGIKECYYLVNIPGCQRVTFDPPLYEPRRPSLNCSECKTWINSKTEDSLIFDQSTLKSNNVTECGYHKISLANGTLNIDPIFHRFNRPVQDDFLLVKCLQRDRVVYEEFLPFIRKRSKNSPAVRSHITKDALSVIMIGLDSTPKSSYFLHMKKTTHYMRENSAHVEMQGFLRSGPAMLPNILTAITGLNLIDYENNSKIKIPFIWDEFSKAGYKTQLIDSDPVSSIFRKSNIFFKSSPTDFYLPPLNKNFVDHSSTWVGGCVNKGIKTSTILRWAEDFIDVFVDQPVFSLIFLNGLTEDGYSAAEYHDRFIRQFLQNLDVKQHTLHTMVVLFGDSSHHFQTQVSPQNQDDEEVPFLTIILPSWFPKKYPERFAHLQSNQFIITSAFDLHETLRDVLRLRGWIQIQERWSPAKSLMQPIDIGRSCAQAGIEDYWCTCIGWEDITALTVHVGEAAMESMEAINGVGNIRGTIEHLDAILEAKRYLPKTSYVLSRSHPALIQLIFRVLPTHDVYLSVVTIYEENQAFQYELKHLDLLIKGY